MRPKSIVLLGLALGCGLVASIGISQVMEARNGQRKQGVQASICVAMADIERSVAVSNENAAMKPWPADELPDGAITKFEDALGRRPGTRIVKGEPILLSKLGTGEGMSRANDIPKGFRVVSVHVNNAENPGLILPGDRVDLQVYASKSPDVAETGTWTFLEDVSVFAVNAETRHDPNADSAKIEARTISLLVTPAQAGLVTLASEMGKIKLIMRGPLPEKNDQPPPAARVTDITGGRQEKGGEPTNPFDEHLRPAEPTIVKPPVTPVDDQVTTMTVVEGTDVRVAEFHKGESLPHWRSGDSAAGSGTQSAPANDNPPTKDQPPAAVVPPQQRPSHAS